MQGIVRGHRVGEIFKRGGEEPKAGICLFLRRSGFVLTDSGLMLALAYTLTHSSMHNILSLAGLALLATIQPMPTLAADGNPRPCDHEGGRLLLHRPDDATTPVSSRALAHHLHETLMAWSAVPGGCRGEVVFEGAGHCGKVYVYASVRL